MEVCSVGTHESLLSADRVRCIWDIVVINNLVFLRLVLT